MAGLDPAIHATQAHAVPVRVDTRHKAGYDGRGRLHHLNASEHWGQARRKQLKPFSALRDIGAKPVVPICPMPGDAPRAAGVSDQRISTMTVKFGTNGS